MLQGCSIGSWEGGAGVGGAFQALGFWFLAIFLFILSGWAIFLKKISNSKHNTTQHNTTGIIVALVFSVATGIPILYLGISAYDGDFLTSFSAFISFLLFGAIATRSFLFLQDDKNKNANST